MRIYVDADACPVKDEVYRVAARYGLPVSVVAVGFIRVPSDPMIERVAAGTAMDAADDWIAQRAGAGDIVVTADIPLAAAVIARGAHALDPRGELYSEANVRERLAIRNLMQDLRATGTLIDGPAPFGPRERRLFADHLDHLLTRRRPA